MASSNICKARVQILLVVAIVDLALTLELLTQFIHKRIDFNTLRVLDCTGFTCKQVSVRISNYKEAERKQRSNRIVIRVNKIYLELK